MEMGVWESLERPPAKRVPLLHSTPRRQGLRLGMWPVAGISKPASMARFLHRSGFLPAASPVIWDGLRPVLARQLRKPWQGALARLLAVVIAGGQPCRPDLRST